LSKIRTTCGAAYVTRAADESSPKAARPCPQRLSEAPVDHLSWGNQQHHAPVLRAASADCDAEWDRHRDIDV